LREIIFAAWHSADSGRFREGAIQNGRGAKTFAQGRDAVPAYGYRAPGRMMPVS